MLFFHVFASKTAILSLNAITFTFLITFFSRDSSSQDFSGKASAFLSMDVLQKLGWDRVVEYSHLVVTGFVTEQFTNTQFNDSASIALKRKRIKVEKIHSPEYVKPSLTYTAYVSSRGTIG